MRLGTKPELTIFARSARIAGTSAVAALTLLGTVAPALADTADPAPVLPDNAYVVTQGADGQLQRYAGASQKLGSEACQIGDQRLPVRDGC